MISSDPAGRGRLGAGPDTAVEARLPLAIAIVVLTFGVFLVRLFQLQLVQGEELDVLSRANSVRTLRLEAPRGEILDREGRTLSTTRPAFGVQVIPNDLHRRERTMNALAMFLGEEAEALDAAVGTPRGRARFHPVRLAGDLEDGARAQLEAHLYALPGVVTDVQPRRHYLAGELAAHLLGFIGEIQKEQLETPAFADYQRGDVIGQSGLERVLEPDLRGRAGGRNQVVDVWGRVVSDLDEIEPVPGGSVTLTLDLDLQHAAEEAFLPDVLGEPTRMGSAVVIDPRNGDLLAMVSKPSYDPNAFAGGIDSETWKGLLNDEWRPIQNRAISGQYPPGSTYKAIVAAAGLEEGVIDPAETVYCPGSFRLGRRTYRCWKREGHGDVDLRDALKFSCDVYFYQLGLKLGVDRIAHYAQGFHLGRRTGISLPQEASGLVPTAAWKERRFSEPWVRGETLSAAIGQGFNLTTPLQLAVAYAAFANGGKIVRPRLVLERRSADGEVKPGPPPAFVGSVPVSNANLKLVLDALEAVVGEPRGTGVRVRLPGVRVAGKTGTSQVVALELTEDLEDDEIPIKFRDHGWFAAIAPVEAPEIVVVALAEHGGSGSRAAGPIARRILERYFATRAPEERSAGTPEPERETAAAPPTAPASASTGVDVAGD